MCKHLPASSVYLHVFVRVRSFSLGAVMFKATHFFLPLSLTVTKLQLLLPLRNVTFFSPVKSTFTVESLLFSPCCLRVLEDKVNTLSEFALQL